MNIYDRQVNKVCNVFEVYNLTWSKNCAKTCGASKAEVNNFGPPSRVQGDCGDKKVVVNIEEF